MSEQNLSELLLQEVRRERRYRYSKLIIFSVLAVMFLLVFSMFLATCSSRPDNQIYETINGNPTAKEEAVIAVIPLYGTIGISGGGETISEENVKAVMAEIEKEPRTKAVVLKIQSPGGVMLPTEKIYQLLKKRLSKVKVVTYVDGFAASGGYYLALAGEYIVAHPMSFVGSIGVIMQTMDVSGLADKVGVKSYTFKSGRLKDTGNPFRELTHEEKDIFTNHIMELQKMFVDRMVSVRGERLKRRDLSIITDAGVFSAKKAQELGLIDDVRDFDETLLGLVDDLDRNKYSKFIVIEYRVPESFFSSTLGKFEGVLSGRGLGQGLFARRVPEFLWLCC